MMDFENHPIGHAGIDPSQWSLKCSFLDDCTKIWVGHLPLHEKYLWDASKVVTLKPWTPLLTQDSAILPMQISPYLMYKDVMS
nr:hypothetical protein Iba_chr14aCG22850 [Ipomoea batatas]